LLTAGEIAEEEGKVPSVRGDVDVEAIPQEAGMDEAILAKGACGVDGLPAGVVERGGGEARIVAGMDEPGRGEIGWMREGRDDKVAGIGGRKGPGVLSGGEGCCGEEGQ
jgi:hypothetical protein